MINSTDAESSSSITYGLPTGGVNTISASPGYSAHSGTVEKITSISSENPQNVVGLHLPYYEGGPLNLKQFTNLTTISPLSGETTGTKLFDTTDGYGVPATLTSLNIEALDTSSVTTLYRAFKSSTKLVTLYANSINTSNVTVMYELFYNCEALNNLFIKNWDTSKVVTMYQMFCGCRNLTDYSFLSSFNTSNVTNMAYMFCQNTHATTITFPDSFNTSKVTNMRNMFSQDTKLTTLNLGNNWNMTACTNVASMFLDCTSLKTITGTISNIKVNLNLSACPLDWDSIDRIVEGLYTYTSGTHTLSLNCAGKYDLYASTGSGTTLVRKQTLVNNAASAKGWTTSWTGSFNTSI